MQPHEEQRLLAKFAQWLQTEHSVVYPRPVAELIAQYENTRNVQKGRDGGER